MKTYSYFKSNEIILEKLVVKTNLEYEIFYNKDFLDIRMDRPSRCPNSFE